MDIETPERLKEDLHLMKEWISKQPHLPKIEDEAWLATILHYNKYSIERTKTKIDDYFTFRTKYPEILKKRDPTGPDMSQFRAACKLVLADKLTKDGELIMFSQLQPDANMFDMPSSMKMFFMQCDAVYLKREKHNDVMAIIDCRYLSHTHFLKMLPWFKVGVDICTAYSGRVSALHVINAPAHLNVVVNTLKGFFPKKLADRVCLHNTMEDLSKKVDEDVVCSDFGGKGPSLAEYEEYTKKTLEKHRQWFLTQDDLCTNELLRRKDANQLEDMQGSFRKLEVD